ncbi:MAG: aldo/keto reductase [Armatimonadetes bacterium]|nr:aldo/keto reductase [Anaerolineae bacterium]
MMNTLPRQQVGGTTLQVPVVGFGTAPLATAPGWRSGDPIPEAQALQALQYAYDEGIRFFDTAPAYVRGLAETRTGKLLGQLPREQFVVATKVGIDITGDNLRRDYSRDGVLRSLESSLKRLQVDHVDILHIHDADDDARQVLDETLPALDSLRSQGIIKAIGVGMNQWRVPMEFAQHADFDCFMIAGRYTLLEQGALPLFDLCHEKGITIFAASIYNSGILATGAASINAAYNHAPPSADISARVQALEAVCRAFDVPLHTAATQFPLAHPAVKSIIVGFQHISEIRACVDALQQTVPTTFWQHLVEAGTLDLNVPLPSMKVIGS